MLPCPAGAALTLCAHGRPWWRPPCCAAVAVLPVQGKSCTETCRQAGLAPVAGEPGTALCANPEKTGWGARGTRGAVPTASSGLSAGCLWELPQYALPPPCHDAHAQAGTQAAPGENCAVQEIGSWSDGFHCACALPKEPLAWRPLATCLTGVASATGGDWPPVCRHRIEHDPARPFRTGWVTGRSGDTGDYVCRAPDGATSVDSMGLLPTEFEVLCRGNFFSRKAAAVPAVASPPRDLS